MHSEIKAQIKTKEAKIRATRSEIKALERQIKMLERQMSHLYKKDCFLTYSKELIKLKNVLKEHIENNDSITSMDFWSTFGALDTLIKVFREDSYEIKEDSKKFYIGKIQNIKFSENIECKELELTTNEKST